MLNKCVVCFTDATNTPQTSDTSSATNSPQSSDEDATSAHGAAQSGAMAQFQGSPGIKQHAAQSPRSQLPGSSAVDAQCVQHQLPPINVFGQPLAGSAADAQRLQHLPGLLLSGSSANVLTAQHIPSSTYLQVPLLSPAHEQRAQAISAPHPEYPS